MSSMGDTSNPPLNDVSPASTSRTRESNASITSNVHKLDFNEFGLPIEDNGKSASRLGKLARTIIPISYLVWRSVEEHYKDKLWKVFKAEFPHLKESQREIFMKKACNAWKKYKAKLRACLVGDDVSQWKRKVPEGIKSEDWEKFCDNEATSSQKQLREANKEVRQRCERKSTHNTGRDGYARAASKWEKKNGRTPTRAELWLSTHLRKDGTYAPHDQKFAEKIQLLLDISQEKGEAETLDSGPLYDVFGKEVDGRVRCVGSSISRTAILSSAYARDILQEVNMDRDGWIKQMDMLKGEMEGMIKSALQKFLNDLKDGKFLACPTDSDVHLNSASTIPPGVAPSTSRSQVPSIDDLTKCKILSYTGMTVGFGRKTLIGAASMVHGYTLKPREVRVILDKIIVPEYPLWGGKQGACHTLDDVGQGGFIYWHDDFLPPDSP